MKALKIILVLFVAGLNVSCLHPKSGNFHKRKYFKYKLKPSYSKVEISENTVKVYVEKVADRAENVQSSAEHSEIESSQAEPSNIKNKSNETVKIKEASTSVSVNNTDKIHDIPEYKSHSNSILSPSNDVMLSKERQSFNQSFWAATFLLSGSYALFVAAAITAVYFLFIFAALAFIASAVFSIQALNKAKLVPVVERDRLFRIQKALIILELTYIGLLVLGAIAIFLVLLIDPIW